MIPLLVSFSALAATNYLEYSLNNISIFADYVIFFFTLKNNLHRIIRFQNDVEVLMQISTLKIICNLRNSNTDGVTKTLNLPNFERISLKRYLLVTCLI